MKNLISLSLLLLTIILLFGVNTLKNENVYKNNLIDSLEVQILKLDSIEYRYSEFLPIGNPLDTIIVGSEFGSRKDPKTGRWSFHEGVDLNGTPWDTVYASGSGVISLSGNCGGYGRCIVIDHVSGLKSRYAHLTKIFIKKRGLVKKGDPIGTVGKTGYTTGYHLHYEIIKDSIYVDPLKWIQLSN